MINEILNILKDLVGKDYLYLDTAIRVKTTPHTPDFNIWAICASGNKLFIMDNNEAWTPVEPEDSLIIPSIYQRVKLIEQQYKIAS